MSRRGQVYYPARYGKFKAAARRILPGICFEAGIHSPIKTALMVCLDLVITRPKRTKLQYPKPDIDNLAKSVLDIGNGEIWDDDRQVVVLDAVKRWSKVGEEGHIKIHIKEVQYDAT